MGVPDPNLLLSELVRLRRMFHAHPETGFTEFWTTARICETLAPMPCTLLYGKELRAAMTDPGLLDERMNLPSYEQSLRTEPGDPWIPKLEGIPGVVAVFKGKGPGPKIGFRFDMDGLPVTEPCSETHSPFKNGFASANGNMHACGHDGHTAMGLGLAGLISSNLDDLAGEIYLLFQPAEETIQGGQVFSKLAFIKDLNHFFSIHLGMSGPGMVTCGVTFFADKRLRVRFKGKGAHAGGAPHAGKNALLAACEAVSALYGIARHSGGSSRINIGEFTSANAVNIIADQVEFELDLRAQTNTVMDYLVHRTESILQGAALMQEVTHEVRFITESATAPNSPDLMAEVRKSWLEMGMKNEQILDRLQVSGSEDATFIMNEVQANGGKATYIGLGSPRGAGHHNENFDINEEDLPKGVILLFTLGSNLSKIPGRT